MHLTCHKVRPSIVSLMAMIILSCSLATAADQPWTEAGSSDAFPVLPLRPQTGWVVSPPDAQAWRPVVAGDLPQRLESAPALQLTQIGPGPLTVWGPNINLIPNPEGSFDLLLNYQRQYRRDGEVFIFDLGKGELVRQFPIARRGGDTLMERHGFEFRSRGYFVNGRMFYTHYGPLFITVYDPAVKDIVHAALPFEGAVRQGSMVQGEDGMLYGAGFTSQWLTPENNATDPGEYGGRIFFYRVNPDTFELTHLATAGPPNRRRDETYNRVMMDGNWIYAAIGHRPWHLVAHNVVTGESRTLIATTDDARGMPIRLTAIEGGFSGSLLNPQGASVHGVDMAKQTFVKFRGRADGDDSFEFWLSDGVITPRTDNVPAWSDEPARSRESVIRPWVGEPHRFVAGDTDRPVPQLRHFGADEEGVVNLEYRLSEDAPWRTIRFQVQRHPEAMARITELNGHTIFGTSRLVGDQLFFNLQNRTYRRIGGHSVYAMGMAGDHFYTSGYSNAVLRQYDFDRPLGGRQTPPNPVLLGRLGHASDLNYPLGRVVVLRDGRIYNAGSTEGRRRVGGGFAWYDPQTESIGGQVFENQSVFWLTGAADDRYLIMSTRGHGEPGRIYCWDAQTHTMRYSEPLAGIGRPGPVVEAMPGLVMGYGLPDEGEGGVLYGLDPATGKLLWTQHVPIAPHAGRQDAWWHNYAFRRGPDGFVWTYMDDVLVRIDPRDLSVHPVGRTSPRQIAFAGGKLFIAGGNGLQQADSVSVPVLE